MASINPTREQFAAVKALPPDAPVQMINLLKFRETASYAQDDPEAAEPSVTGREAYRRYAEESEPIVTSLGGSQAWIGAPQTMVIGPDEEDWDHAFVARYPTAQAFVDMVRNPDYQRAVRHRTAAVADSRLICCSEAAPGKTFLSGEFA